MFAITYNPGTLYSSDITAAMTTAGVGQAPDRRRLFDLSNRVIKLTPEETPFFVYLSGVSKVPTKDSIFRYLEDRTPVDWTNRNFYLAADVNSGSAVTAGISYAFSIDDGSGSIDWLIKGMVFTVNTVSSATGFAQAVVRVDDVPVDAGTTTTFNGRILDVSANITGYNVLSDNDSCQVIGTAYGEGTGSPDVWSSDIEDNFGYTQIFKTAAELTNTAIATTYRGYANEWERIWGAKIREHKVDLERAMLFGHKTRVNGIQTTEGLVGHILKNGTVQTTGATDLSYTSGKPFLRSVASTELSFNLLLRDFQVLFDSSRGGQGDRLVLCGPSTITAFNLMSDGSFIDNSMGYSNSPFRQNMQEKDGVFGHKLLTVNTVHGTAHLVKEQLFTGQYAGLMLFADMSTLAYRPLVGNGLNRDTHVITNVQNPDEDLRKDMILTEAGFEVGMPENQMLYILE